MCLRRLSPGVMVSVIVKYKKITNFRKLVDKYCGFKYYINR